MEQADEVVVHEQTFDQPLGVPLMDNEEGEGTYDNLGGEQDSRGAREKEQTRQR